MFEREHREPGKVAFGVAIAISLFLLLASPAAGQTGSLPAAPEAAATLEAVTATPPAAAPEPSTVQAPVETVAAAAVEVVEAPAAESVAPMQRVVAAPVQPVRKVAADTSAAVQSVAATEPREFDRAATEVVDSAVSTVAGGGARVIAEVEKRVAGDDGLAGGELGGLAREVTGTVRTTIERVDNETAPAREALGATLEPLIGPALEPLIGPALEPLVGPALEPLANPLAPLETPLSPLAPTLGSAGLELAGTPFQAVAPTADAPAALTTFQPRPAPALSPPAIQSLRELGTEAASLAPASPSLSRSIVDGMSRLVAAGTSPLQTLAAAGEGGLESPSPLDFPTPAPEAPGAVSPGVGGTFFVPLAALLALLALAVPATMRRLREVAGLRSPIPFVCALERPG